MTKMTTGPKAPAAFPKTLDLPGLKPKEKTEGTEDVKVPLRPQQPTRDGVASGEEAGAIASTTGGVAFGNKTETAQPGGGVLGFMNAQKATTPEQLQAQTNEAYFALTRLGGQEVSLEGLSGSQLQGHLDQLSHVIESPQAAPEVRASAQALRGTVLIELGDPAKVGYSPDGFSMLGAKGERGAPLDRDRMRDRGLADIQAALPKLSLEQKTRVAPAVGKAMSGDFMLTDREQALLNDFSTQLPRSERHHVGSAGMNSISIPEEQLPKALEWRQELRDIYQIPNETEREARLSDFAKGLDRIRQQGGDDSLLAGQMLYNVLERPSTLAPRGSYGRVDPEAFGGEEGVDGLQQWLCERLDPNFLAARSPMIDDTIDKLGQAGKTDQAAALSQRYLSGFDTPGAPVHIHSLGLRTALRHLPPEEQAEAIARYTKQAEANIKGDPETQQEYTRGLRFMARDSRFAANKAQLLDAAMRLDPDPAATMRDQLDALDVRFTGGSREVDLRQLDTSKIQGGLDELSGMIRSKKTPPELKARAQALRGATLCELADPKVAGRSSVFTLPAGKGKRGKPLSAQQLSEKGFADLAAAVPQLKGDAAKDAARLVGLAVAADGMLSVDEQDLIRAYAQRLPEGPRSLAVEGSFNDIHVPEGQAGKALQWRQELNSIHHMKDQDARQASYEDFARGLEQVRRQGGDEAVLAGQLLYRMARHSYDLTPNDAPGVGRLELDKIMPPGQGQDQLERWLFDNVDPEFTATRGFIADKVLGESGQTGDLKDTLSIIDRYSQAFDKPGAPAGHHAIFLREALEATPPSEHQRIIDKWLVQARANAATDPSVKKHYFEVMLHGSGQSEELDAQLKKLATMFE